MEDIPNSDVNRCDLLPACAAALYRTREHRATSVITAGELIVIM
jgi:hypothetical protein